MVEPESPERAESQDGLVGIGLPMGISATSLCGN